MIEARGLTKRYGDTLAVDGLTFDIRPGVVTGFLGPNGARILESSPVSRLQEKPKCQPQSQESP